MRYELTKDLETGNAVIDREHRELFRAVNELLDSCGKGQGRAAMEPAIQFLICGPAFQPRGTASAGMRLSGNARPQGISRGL